MARRRTEKRNIIKSKIYISEKIHFNIRELESKFYRADIIFKGVNHAVPSYEGRIFINNPEADYNTKTELSKGYVGSYFVFGHGSCLGDAGHCDVHAPRQRFDVIPNTLVPEDISVIITDKLRTLGKRATEFTVTIVPILVPPPVIGQEEVDLESVMKIDGGISIVTYDKEQ